MSRSEVTALDADATLTFVERARAAAERAEVDVLRAAAHWADLHAVTDEAVRGVTLPGCEQLIPLGGEGTPEVAEFAPAELGAVLAMSPYAAGELVADALDLRHRLPRLWSRIVAGEVKPWVGRKAAQATRRLTAQTAAVVDRRIARWAHSLSWGRLAALIDATVLEADPDAAAVAAAGSDLGVWVAQSTEQGFKDIFIRAEAPDAIRFDAAVDRTADGLGLLGDDRSKDARRAAAIGVLASPQRALDLFDEAATAAGVQPETAPVDSGRRRVEPRPPAILYVHLSDEALQAGRGVARVEGIGPIGVDRLPGWLRDCQVTVKPVIDLNNQVPVDAYEVPDRMRETVRLRSPVDVFPYATNSGRRMDLDHTDEYVDPDTGGPPGQTRSDNLGPMTRFHHRIKTHGGWQVRQVYNGVFVWRSPHGRHFLVDHTGTRRARIAG